MRNKIKLNNNGFTLVEIIVTIVVLGLISVPMMMYFSQAQKHAARTKEKQNAVIAGQNALEELKSADINLDKPDELTAVSTASPMWGSWTIEATPAPGSSDYIVEKKCVVNNGSYKVRAAINPLTQFEGIVSSGSAVSGTKNVTYKSADVPAMDSSKDIIATESSTILANARYYFYECYMKACDADNTIVKDSAVTPNWIGDRLERVIRVSMKPESSIKLDSVVIKITCEYKLKSGVTLEGCSGTHIEEIEADTIDVDDLRSIYVFYNPDASGDSMIVQKDPLLSTIKEGQLNLYVIAQNSVSSLRGTATGVVVRADAYKMNVTASDTGAGVSALVGKCFKKVYTNLSPNTQDIEDGLIADASKKANELVLSGFTSTALAKSDGCNTMISRDDMSRLAIINITVYRDKGDSSHLASDIITQIEGTKVLK